ncbi:nitrogen permease regulator of amino acid transport activity 3-domain-containing protein [Geopyxis carbonaria]|nr:nitrogen permease regulator of amino acid transport activity 3-domain-containing protein [Geopyxis carbonaria]
MTATPNSCLVAILLIARSSSGPTLSFHYPLRPKPDAPTSRRLLNYDSSSSSSSSGSDSDSAAPAPGADAESRVSKRDDGAKDKPAAGDSKPDADEVLGFKTDFLAGLLAPKLAAGKGTFEMSVDDLVFLGAPVHVRPDGTWRKRKKRVDPSENEDEEDGGEGEAGESGGEGGEAGGDGGGGESEGGGGGSERGTGSMSMFHVVFVLNPPELEYHFRTQEMFDYVVKRFSRALKYEQAKDGYVWREVETIARLKETAAQNHTPQSELWNQITSTSSLGYALFRIYSDITTSKISHVLLNNTLMLSLQIPIVTEIAMLPSITDPQLPGLPLTTANSFGDDDTSGDSLLAKHFTLLYLDSLDSILSAISASSPSTTLESSLSLFVKHCKPTLSFLQISHHCGLPLHEIQVLARHLVHWRKARAIPPIHQRDVYIVSPNADMKRLPALITAYARAFPSLPALPKILALLSGKPKPYATFIPSRDHRGAYLDILTWLIRHGLVTQLRNFAWVKAPRTLKIRVRREIRALAASAGMGGLAAADDGGGMLCGDTAEEDAEEEAALEDSFILEPAQASGPESAWLEMMTRDQPPDVKALFERFLKYLNGKHALEKISVREGVSRKEVRRVMKTLQEFIVYAKHW